MKTDLSQLLPSIYKRIVSVLKVHRLKSLFRLLEFWSWSLPIVFHLYVSTDHQSTKIKEVEVHLSILVIDRIFGFEDVNFDNLILIWTLNSGQITEQIVEIKASSSVICNFFLRKQCEKKEEK